MIIERISAIDLNPIDCVREVSPAAIDYYVEELSGLFLPPDFVEANIDSDPQLGEWGPDERLRGSFGRFVVDYYAEQEGDLANVAPAESQEMLVMGTTIGLPGPYYNMFGMRSLKHVDLLEYLKRASRNEADQKGMITNIRKVDFGHTEIVLGEDGTVKKLLVSGSSYDFGRADEIGRSETCRAFERALEGVVESFVEVVNVNQVPRGYDRIIPAE
jgi:hypothetical protein